MYCDNVDFCIKRGFENTFKLAAYFLKFHKNYLYQTDYESDNCLSLYIHYILFKYEPQSVKTSLNDKVVKIELITHT